MLQIKNLVIFVVFSAIVQSQAVSYLKSHARYTPIPITFPCNSEKGRRAEGSGNLFHCNATLCTTTQFVCDSIVDCPNFADERADDCTDEWREYCAVLSKPNNRKPFRAASCGNGMCIPECDVCDGRYVDCSDASDEILCSGRDRPNWARCKDYYSGLPEEFLAVASSWGTESGDGETL